MRGAGGCRGLRFLGAGERGAVRGALRRAFYAEFSTPDGLVIDVKRMRAVSVDPANGTVTVAGGANNADIGDTLAPYGVYFPGGRCPRSAFRG